MDKYFFWGFGRVCVKHKVGRFLSFLRVLIGELEVGGKSKQILSNLSPRFYGFCSHLQGGMDPINSSGFSAPFNMLRLNELLGQLVLCAQQIDEKLPFSQEDLVLSMDDFLPGSLVNVGDSEFRVEQKVSWSKEALSDPKPWGSILCPSDIWPEED